MITIFRTSPAPKILADEAVFDQLKHDEKHFRSNLQSRRQERWQANAKIYNHVEVKERLWKCFGGKCAYCEAPIISEHPSQGPQSLRLGQIVDHYRPTSGAVGLKKDYAPDHYWWLSYDWNNLYLCCHECNEYKGTKFPVRGSRATFRAGRTNLLREKPLLVDPCSDRPEQHFKYKPTGEIVGRTAEGRATILILNLNRTTLRFERARLIVAIRPAINVLHMLKRRIAGFSREATPEQCTEHLNVLRNEPSKKSLKSLVDDLTTRLGPEASFSGVVAYFVARELGGRNRATPILKQIRKNNPVVKPVRLSETEKISTRRLIGIRLRNFRGISALDITCGQSDPSDMNAPWNMILGENSCGKTSILSAVALALIGEKRRRALKISPAHILRQGTKSGYVRLRFNGKPENVELNFDTKHFTCTLKEPNMPVLGYGATRLLPRPPHIRGTPLTGQVRVANLFNPFFALTNAKQWLLEQDEERFDYTARAIKDVLNLAADAKLLRGSIDGERNVFVRLFGKKIPLKELSDGYQSIIGLTVDIIKALNAARVGGFEAAEGIVLLDEIGAHLHPRWRMRVVKSLRRAFPRVQFLVSTHDPLCMRGLHDGEITVLRRNKRNQVYAVNELPPIEGMTAEQILTSEFFGLHSTIDPDVETQFNKYYELLALPSPNDEEKLRLDELSAALEPKKVLGTSQRERILLRIIDRYLALRPQEPNSTAFSRMESIVRKELLSLGLGEEESEEL